MERQRESWIRWDWALAFLRLDLPVGAVSVPAMGTGLVTWENGHVTVEAVDLTGPMTVEGGVLAN